MCAYKVKRQNENFKLKSVLYLSQIYCSEEIFSLEFCWVVSSKNVQNPSIVARHDCLPVVPGSAVHEIENHISASVWISTNYTSSVFVNDFLSPHLPFHLCALIYFK